MTKIFEVIIWYSIGIHTVRTTHNHIAYNILAQDDVGARSIAVEKLNNWLCEQKIAPIQLTIYYCEIKFLLELS